MVRIFSVMFSYRFGRIIKVNRLNHTTLPLTLPPFLDAGFRALTLQIGTWIRGGRGLSEFDFGIRITPPLCGAFHISKSNGVVCVPGPMPSGSGAVLRTRQ